MTLIGSSSTVAVDKQDDAMTEIPYTLRAKRVWVAGHRGMAGSAIVRRLASEHCEVLTASRQEVDLRRQAEVETWMAAKRPHAVFIAAATVGGILANSTRPAEFLYDNLTIESNIIHAAWRTGVEKLMLLGSSCIYPKLAPQPIVEEALLSGPLEPTNEWYAIAKIAGIKLCQAFRRQYGCDFISAMPTNLYGPRDNYDLETSHVVAALQVKIHRAVTEAAKSVQIWGTGAPRREFLHADDLADALVFLMKNYSGESHVNVGTGTDVTINELAALIARVANYRGTFVHDLSKPDGTPQKVMDVSRLANLGWTAKIPLEQGLESTYRWYVDHAVGCAAA
jgi:GDP-L-fucose synthase